MYLTRTISTGLEKESRAQAPDRERRAPNRKNGIHIAFRTCGIH